MLSFSAYLAEQYTSRDQALKAAKQSFPDKKQYRWNGMPNIGWWADKNAVIFYHGTHFTNLEPMLATGIKAPNHGPTAGWVSHGARAKYRSRLCFHGWREWVPSCWCSSSCSPSR